MVQCLELRAFTPEDVSSIPGWGTKIPQTTWNGKKKKKKLAMTISRVKIMGDFLALYIIRGFPWRFSG